MFRLPAVSPRLLPCLMLLSGFVLSAAVRADEKLADKACRSVHLWYQAKDVDALYNEITVEKSAPATYFMVCGWSRGYYGIQELANGKKVILFSVWDSNENDPNATAQKDRVTTFEPAPGVRVKRFGHEGSGGQSFYDYDWKIGQTLRFAVSAEPNGSRTAYSGWFYHPEQQQWIRLMTFATLTPKPERLTGLYSFVEDFQRNGVSATRQRVASFGNTWVLTPEGDWKAISQVRFTADSNPSLKINAGLRGDRFFLATGGETTNSDTPLNGKIELPNAPRTAPDWKPTRVVKEPAPTTP